MMIEGGRNMLPRGSSYIIINGCVLNDNLYLYILDKHIGMSTLNFSFSICL